MQLKQLLSLKEETEGILQKYKETFEVKEFASLEELKEYVNKQKEKNGEEMSSQTPNMVPNGKSDSKITLQECMLIAATDKTILWANSIPIAVAAYENPHIEGQALTQVEMVIEGFEEVDAVFLKKTWQRYYHLPWTIAVTERCVIRELTLGDMDALFALYKEEELCRFTESLFDKEEETDYQRAYINNMYRYFGYGIWLVFQKETGALIGRAGVEHREYHGELELELGYLIGTNYQRQGYATEVCKAIIAYAREEIGALAINCLIEEENRISIALARKLGFSFLEYFPMNEKQLLHFRMELANTENL